MLFKYKIDEHKIALKKGKIPVKFHFSLAQIVQKKFFQVSKNS